MVIHTPDQVTTSWLTRVLRNSGDLIRGEVTAVKPLIEAGNWSSNARLCLTYSPDSSGKCPASVFLKSVQTDSSSEDYFDDSEVRYYLNDYVDVTDAPLLRCYDSAYDRNCYHLLLEDVSKTHQPSVLVTPTLKYGQSLAESVAVLHSQYWATRHSVSMPTAIQVQRYVDVAKPGLKYVLDDPNFKLEPRWSDVLNRFFAIHPQRLVARLRMETGFTLVHGDLNGFNILVPKASEGRIYLIDRQPFEWSLTTWLGVSDLAFALISDWTPEQRRECEHAILQHYHRKLKELGIVDYSWDQLWQDYQLCLVMGVYNAVEFCKKGIDEAMRGRWQSLLTRSLAALEESEELSDMCLRTKR